MVGRFRRWWRALWDVLHIPERTAVVVAFFLLGVTLALDVPEVKAKQEKDVAEVTVHKMLVNGMPCLIVEMQKKSGIAVTCDWSRLPEPPPPPPARPYGHPEKQPGRVDG